MESDDNIFRKITFRSVMVLVLIFIICFFTILTVYNTIFIISIQKIDMKATIGQGIGFRDTSSNLDFGTGPPGSTITKSLRVENTRPHNILASIKFTGNISDFITISDNNFIVTTKESKKVNITLNIPQSASRGNLTGKAQVFIKRK